MISDAVMGAVLAAYQGFVGLLPVMPAKPVDEFGKSPLDRIVNLAYTVDYLLPVSEIFGFLTTTGLVIFGALLLWRLVRFLWIGGG